MNDIHTPEWTDDEVGDVAAEGEEARVRIIVARLLKLASDPEAQRLLGVEGTLEDSLDLMFVADPLAWIANDIAQAIRVEDDELETITLSSIVASLRLYQVLVGEPDPAELAEAVLDYLDEDDADDEA